MPTKQKIAESSIRGFTPPAIIISLGYFLIEVSAWAKWNIPENIILNGVVLGYGIVVGIQHGIKR